MGQSSCLTSINTTTGKIDCTAFTGYFNYMSLSLLCMLLGIAEDEYIVTGNWYPSTHILLGIAGS